jgi:hypothetical protein
LRFKPLNLHSLAPAAAFSVFDREGRLTCDVREIGTVVRSLNINPSEKQLQKVKFKPHIASHMEVLPVPPVLSDL